MMNVFTASDLEAADLLALARHDDDGAPPAVTPPPASDGQGCHAIRRAGTGQVTASQPDMIAARPLPPAGGHEANLSCHAGPAEPRQQ